MTSANVLSISHSHFFPCVTFIYGWFAGPHHNPWTRDKISHNQTSWILISQQLHLWFCDKIEWIFPVDEDDRLTIISKSSIWKTNVAFFTDWTSHIYSDSLMAFVLRWMCQTHSACVIAVSLSWPSAATRFFTFPPIIWCLLETSHRPFLRKRETTSSGHRSLICE